MLFFGRDLRAAAPVLDFDASEGIVRSPDLQELGERIEALTEKVDALRRFL